LPSLPSVVPKALDAMGTEFAREKTLFLIGYMAEKFQQITAVANRELSIRANDTP
jgi:hypothetical protein